MPRYDYECSSCGHAQELVFRMAEKPDTVPCPLCHAEACSVISDRIEVLCKDNQYAVKKDSFCLPGNWHKGDADPARYEQEASSRWQSERNQALAVDKKAIRNGWRKIATVPGSLDRLRRRQFGKQYWEDDTKKKLKADGLLFKD